MENIIKGLQILNTYNGKLQARLDLIRLEDFEYKNLLAEDEKILKECEWSLMFKRNTGELIRASYDCSKLH